ncbi:g7945 [Coccomyxa viridis]|uniref:G7945 protein n=1 Tax=Coccomyxa viridis TaxID=1274662 RepID=A0ABP1G1M1_9CHLO
MPCPEILRALSTCPFPARHNCANLDWSFFYYNYSGYAGDWKASPKVVAYEGDGTMGALDQDALRFEGHCTLQQPRSSTHCTDCFSTIATFQNKVALFAHWQLNGPPFTEPEYILHKVRSGLAIHDTDELPCMSLLSRQHHTYEDEKRAALCVYT